MQHIATPTRPVYFRRSLVPARTLQHAATHCETNTTSVFKTKPRPSKSAATRRDTMQHTTKHCNKHTTCAFQMKPRPSKSAANRSLPSAPSIPVCVYLCVCVLHVSVCCNVLQCVCVECRSVCNAKRSQPSALSVLECVCVYACLCSVRVTVYMCMWACE